MKIGFLSVFNYGHNIGGVENHIYFLSRALSNKQDVKIYIFQPIFITKNNNLKEIEIVNNNIIRVYIFLFPNIFVRIINKLNRLSGMKFIGYFIGFINKARYCFYYKDIAKNILKYNIDILHQHDFISNIFTTKYIAKNTKIKCILTNHTGEYLFFKSNLFGRLILRILLNHFSAIIGPSKELTPETHNSFTIYNGVDLNCFNIPSTFEKQKIRLKYGLSESDYLIFCPRRWAPTKGIIYLIESILRYKYPSNIKFLFAGDQYKDYPEYRKKIESLILKVKEKDRIIRFGNLDINDIIHVYKMSDVVIIPSLMEAVSLSALEAMASGCAVIATKVGGMLEIIKDKENGLLIAPANPKEIFDAVMMLYFNKELHNLIVYNSLQVVKNFSWDYIAEETLKIYRKILN